MTTARRLMRVVAVLMLAQSALGLLAQDRYRDTDWIRAAWYGNDWITLVVAVPLLLVGQAFATRGSARGLLLALGLLGYAAYNYAYYLFGAALNVFLPLYVVLLVAAVVALMLAVSSPVVSNAAVTWQTTPAVRVTGVYFVTVALALSVVWVGMWAAYVFAGRSTPVAPETFKLVAALDLSLMVPALAYGGLLLCWQRPLGILVGAIAGVQASLYLLVLAVSSLIAIERGIAEWPGEFLVWGPLAVATAVATLPFFTRAPTRRAGVPSPSFRLSAGNR